MSNQHFYSHNVDLKESLERHALGDVMKKEYGEKVRIGPAWDDLRKQFVDAPLAVGVYFSTAKGASLADAQKIFDRQDPVYRCNQ